MNTLAKWIGPSKHNPAGTLSRPSQDHNDAKTQPPKKLHVAAKSDGSEREPSGLRPVLPACSAKSRSELIAHLEAYLAVDDQHLNQQNHVVERLKEIGADASDAVEFLNRLLELKENRARRLAYLLTLPDDIPS